MTTVRSGLFLLWFVALTAVMAILFLPLLALPRSWAIWMPRLWARATLGGLRILAGTAMRVVGHVPRGAVLVAAKHMSMWETLALYIVLDDPAVVLKQQLLRIPFYGWYLGKIAAIPIDRQGGASALRGMAQRAGAVLAAGRPIVIFPEGTRRKPGGVPDYKPGVAGLYSLLNVDCVPAALNSGVFWRGFWKYPGVITLEFLEPIAPGLKRGDFMRQLESRIETATARLVQNP